MWIKPNRNLHRSNTESLRRFAEMYFKRELDDIREDYWIIITGLEFDLSDGWATLYIEYGASGEVKHTWMARPISQMKDLNKFEFEV